MRSAVKNSEDHFKDLVETANIGMSIDDSDGNFIYLNEKYAEIFGYSRQEIKKRNVRAVVHPEDSEKVLEYRRGIHLGRTAHSRYECRGIKKDGSVIYLETVASALKKNGNIIGTHSCIWDITRRKKLEKGHESTLTKLKAALRGFIQALAKSVEERDPFTSDHQQRVADLARAIAEEMGLSKNKIDCILMAGVIHDIGKIKVPAEILNKTKNITETEYEIIKTHPQVSYDILKNIAFPWPISQIVFQHHERLDGSGYPLGLSGEDIRLEARILAVADVVEAICSHRPYRAALGVEAAVEEITRNKGRLYDPDVVTACIRLLVDRKYQFKFDMSLP